MAAYTNKIHYTYNMGFKVGDHPLPDPSKYTGVDSNLDTSAYRDANGNLHRTMVANKRPIKLEWSCIEQNVARDILGWLGPAIFEFTRFDPRKQTFLTSNCYAGDRDWEVLHAPSVPVAGESTAKDWLISLKVSIIEY